MSPTANRKPPRRPLSDETTTMGDEIASQSAAKVASRVGRPGATTRIKLPEETARVSVITKPGRAVAATRRTDPHAAIGIQPASRGAPAEKKASERKLPSSVGTSTATKNASEV